MPTRSAVRPASPAAVTSLPLQAAVQLPLTGSGRRLLQRSGALTVERRLHPGYQPQLRRRATEHSLVSGDLIVPNGEWCDVIDTTVTGDLVVSGGSEGLRVAGSTIDGNLVASRATGAADPLSSGANVVCDTIVKGSVNVSTSSSSVPWDIGLCGGLRPLRQFTSSRLSGSGRASFKRAPRPSLATLDGVVVSHGVSCRSPGLL